MSSPTYFGTNHDYDADSYIESAYKSSLKIKKDSSPMTETDYQISDIEKI